MKIVEDLPKEEKVYGVWLTPNNGTDVHIYVSKRTGSVIGHYVSYTDDINFTDIAVSLKDNKVVVQYASENKELIMTEVSKKKTHALILEFLNKMKELAIEET